MIEGDQNWKEVFCFLSRTDPGSIPEPSGMPIVAHLWHAMTVSNSFAQYIALSKCIWLITSSKTERACANRFGTKGLNLGATFH